MNNVLHESLDPLWSDFEYAPHQLDGVRWMLRQERVGIVDTDGSERQIRGGLQCDDMGLGKTIQTLALLVHHPLERTLILCPLAMIDSWVDVCHRAGFRVHCVTGSKRSWWTIEPPPEDNGPVIDRRSLHVYVTNYDKIRYPTLAHLFDEGWAWDRIVVDEAHVLRTASSQLTEAACQIKAPYRWALTGTPIVNARSDAVSLLRFLGARGPPDALFPRILLHRSMDLMRSVIAAAPVPPVHHHLSLRFVNEDEALFYQGIQTDTPEMRRLFRGQHLAGAEILVLLLRLRQLSVSPRVYQRAMERMHANYVCEEWTRPSTKLCALRQVIQEDHDNEPGHTHRYLVFCQFHDEIDLIRTFLITENIFPAEEVMSYDGRMTHAQRGVVLRTSKRLAEEQRSTVLLMQLQSGGVGLNLQEYDRVIFVSPWWTSSLRDQAIARTVRMGQTREVHVYHLRLADLEDRDDIIHIDERIHSAAEQKSQLLRDLFDSCTVTPQPPSRSRLPLPSTPSSSS